VCVISAGWDGGAERQSWYGGDTRPSVIVSLYGDGLARSMQYRAGPEVGARVQSMGLEFGLA
jgi:hypothetical protein